MNRKSIFTNQLKFRLSFYLSNPLFYVTAILFSIFVCVNFFIRQQFFTGSGTTDLLLFFSSVPYISILAIPSLCYKLSFSVYDDFIPINNFKKILIHFITVLILYFFLLLLLIPGVILINRFGKIDIGQFFSSFICLIFYGAAVISVCLFINEIFNKSILSFVISAVILAVFNSAHLFTVYVELPLFITNFCKYISFAWHFDAAGKGIIDTRDLLWLAGSAFLFLILTLVVKEKIAGKKYNGNEKFERVCLILISVFFMLNSNQYFKRIDFSECKTYSLSPITKELSSRIQEPLKITFYRSGSLSKLYPQIRDVSDFLTEFVSQNKNLSLIIKDPDKDDSLPELLNSYGITSQQMQTLTKNSKELVNVYSAIVLEYKGNVEVIPFVMSAETLEYDLDGRIKYLISGQIRVVNIVLGNGLSYDGEDDYNYLIPWLNSQGFICNPLFIQDPDFTTKLEDSTGPLLVIGDSELTIDNSVAIENYILSGKGNGFFAVSPFSADITGDWSLSANLHTNIIEMLENWGVTFTENITADISCSQITMISSHDESNPFSQNEYITEVLNYPLWVNLMPQENSKLGFTVFWPVQLQLSGNAQPYLVTSPASYFYTADRKRENSVIETNPFMLNEGNFTGEKVESQIVAARITGPLSGLYNYGSCDDSNIIVISDPYFVNSLMLGYNGNDFRNFDFLIDSLLRLNNETDLAELHSKHTRDNTLFKISSPEEFKSMQKYVYTVIFAIIPLFIVIVFVIIFIFHNRRYRHGKKFIKK